MSREKEARDIALKEYNQFMEKYKEGVEAGNPKLMLHMLKLEANKVRTQDIVNSIEKSSAGIDENIYDFEDDKMKIQMSSEEYRKDQAREDAFIKMATRDTTQEDEEPKQAPISIGDPDKMDAYTFTDVNPSDFGQIAPIEPPKKEPKPTPSAIEIDPETGKKVYKGPKLRSRKVVDGKEWNEQHPGRK